MKEQEERFRQAGFAIQRQFRSTPFWVLCRVPSSAILSLAEIRREGGREKKRGDKGEGNGLGPAPR